MSAFSWFPPILSRMNIHQKIQQVVLFERRFPDTTISDMTCPVVSNRDLSEHSRWKFPFFWSFLFCIRFLCWDPWEKTISNRNICLGFLFGMDAFLGARWAGCTTVLAANTLDTEPWFLFMMVWKFTVVQCELLMTQLQPNSSYGNSCSPKQTLIHGW